MSDNRWTTEEPTKAGWYWVYTKWGEVKAIEVVKNMNKFITTEANGEYWMDVNNQGYQYWIGPMEIPSISDLPLNNP